MVPGLLTLYITPVYYVYIENARMWLAGHRSQGAAEQVPEAAPVGAAHGHALRDSEGAA